MAHDRCDLECTYVCVTLTAIEDKLGYNIHPVVCYTFYLYVCILHILCPIESKRKRVSVQFKTDHTYILSPKETHILACNHVSACKRACLDKSYTHTWSPRKFSQTVTSLCGYTSINTYAHECMSMYEGIYVFIYTHMILYVYIYIHIRNLPSSSLRNLS